MFDKENKSIKDEINNLKASKTENIESGKNELLQFFLGIILLGVGLFLLSKRVMVSSNWYSWNFGGFNLSSGLVTVPLIIGIIFLLDKALPTLFKFSNNTSLLILNFITSPPFLIYLN